MLITIITILAIGVILFVLSYFMNDRLEEVENQLEQFSITTMQDSYQMKKKIKILEEELLPENTSHSTVSNDKD
ncbi:hypothetical protein [Oceanobacillus sp. FSL H7-0719]|uniref:hypothetical protein n=1 Tax=Oceanobacillus sp. FSL H7-0719 TaxID=2954507 RepID=UPI0032490048